MEDLIDAVVSIFRIMQKTHWDVMDDESKKLMREAKGKVDRAREFCSSSAEGGERPRSGGATQNKVAKWKADSEGEKDMTKRLIDWFENEPEGEQLNEFETDVLNSCMKKFESFGSVTVKQLEILKKAWDRVTNGKALPSS